MNYENFKQGFDKPSIFTAQQYGTKVSVEVDHSDMDLDEVMDALQTLIIGLGYHENSFKNWVIDRANEYNETDAEELKEKLEAWKFDDESIEELENDFFGSYDAEAEKRMDIIGQNGNDGLHYRATDEDEDEFDDYGKRIEHQTFEWGDEPEEDYDGQFGDWKNETPEDDNLFEGDGWKPNQKLVEANDRYKKEVKKMNTKKKNNKK
jgi:molybdopterin converting factor small subunit